ncbi:MAG: glycosyl transferase, family 2 [Ilumatobacteraceae bacterium]|nr:glycosyl transferase, family 2 [Ilumatobacteraceae bacterium]
MSRYPPTIRIVGWVTVAGLSLSLAHSTRVFVIAGGLAYIALVCLCFAQLLYWTISSTRPTRTPPGPSITPERVAVAIISVLLENETTTLPTSIKVLQSLADPPEILVASNGTNLELESYLAADHSLIWCHSTCSTSKASNLVRASCVVSGSPISVLLDADTRPVLEMPLSSGLSGDFDIIQFPRLIRREKGSIIESVVAIETATKVLTVYPLRYLICSVAYLGGSGAVLHCAALAELDPSMLLEDVDLSIRALLAGGIVSFNESALFSEEAPASLRAWHRQRRRWASGWVQLAIKYATLLVGFGELPIRARLCWLWLLAIRRVAIPLLWLTTVTVAVSREDVHRVITLCVITQLVAFARCLCAWRARTRIRKVWGRSLFMPIWCYLVFAVPYAALCCANDLISLLNPVTVWKPTQRA